jgi:hypothetical protein
MLRTAAGYLHADPHWWRKILIGGALSLTLVGGVFGAGLVVEQMDNARRGFPTPMPPWVAWSSRALIGLFALMVDILYLLMPWLVALILFFCGAFALVLAGDGAQANTIAYVFGAILMAWMLVVFLLGVAPLGRLIFIDDSGPERALSSAPLREALRRDAWRLYLRARIVSLPAYGPFVALACLSGWIATLDGPGIALGLLVALWLTSSALLYAHLIVAHVYVIAEQRVGGVIPRAG